MQTYLDYIKGEIEKDEITPRERFINYRRLMTSFHTKIINAVFVNNSLFYV
jgi:hypothetical protein